MSGPNAPAAVSAQQAYRTPPAFLDAVKRRLGWDAFDFDLACTSEDSVSSPMSPGATGPGWWHPQYDALVQDWKQLVIPRAPVRCWLNPPFNLAGKFAAKCAESGATIAALVPVALGTRWWRQYVHERAVVLGVGRLTFNLPDGTPMPTAINRDCALLVYGDVDTGGPGGREFIHYPLEDWKTW